MVFRALDLGRLKSVANIPSFSAHQQQGEEGRDLAGIPANLIRLGAGVGYPDDITADLGGRWTRSRPRTRRDGSLSAAMASLGPRGNRPRGQRYTLRCFCRNLSTAS